MVTRAYPRLPVARLARLFPVLWSCALVVRVNERWAQSGGVVRRPPLRPTVLHPSRAESRYRPRASSPATRTRSGGRGLYSGTSRAI